MLRSLRPVTVSIVLALGALAEPAAQAESLEALMLANPYAQPASGSLIWLRADAVNGAGNPLPSNGSAVSTWTDTSGNSNNFSAVGAPTFITSGIAGLPSINFSGSVQYFSRAAIAGLGSSDITFFAVANGTAAPASREPALFGNSGWNGLVFERSTYGSGGWTTYSNYGGSGTTAISGGVVLPVGGFAEHIFAAQKDVGTSVSMQLDSVPGTVSTATSLINANPNGTLYVGYNNGGNNYGEWWGRISEMIIYNRLLTPDEINQTGTYLAQKYGISSPNYNFDFPVPLTPEPGSIVLGLTLLVGGAIFYRRQMRRSA